MPLRKSFNANDLIFRTVEDGFESVDPNITLQALTEGVTYGLTGAQVRPVDRAALLNTTWMSPTR